jgi:predicted nucleic acid-binding protein
VIVLDASVLIAYLDGEDAHHGAAESLLAREIDDEFAVDPLTLAEVLVGPARAGRLDTALGALRALEVRELPFPPSTAVRLAGLRVETGLRMPDCCVLLAGQDAAARIAAFDDRLVRAAEGVGLTALRQ